MEGDMKLSQAEIDALLNHAGPVHVDAPSLSDFERDALGEIGNISFGSAATALSTLLQQRVDITTPRVNLLRQDAVRNEFPRPYVMITVEYTQGLSGSNALAIELQDAKTIADLMLGGDGTHVAGELNELHLSAVGEAMNQMMGSAATAMSSIFGRAINISPPRVEVVDLSTASALEIGDSEWIVDVAFNLKVGSLIDSKIMQLLPFQFARDLVLALQNIPTETPAGAQETSARTNGTAGQGGSSSHLPFPSNSGPTSDETLGTVDTIQPQSPRNAAVGQAGAPAVMEATLVHRPDFSDFTNEPAITGFKESRNLSLLFDVPLTVTVELGRTRKSIKEILDMSSGAILELDKLAGEPVDILVNNKKIAIGEVVVIDENFGVRVTDILSPVERVKNLQ